MTSQFRWYVDADLETLLLSSNQLLTVMHYAHNFMNLLPTKL